MKQRFTSVCPHCQTEIEHDIDGLQYYRHLADCAQEPEDPPSSSEKEE